MTNVCTMAMLTTSWRARQFSPAVSAEAMNLSFCYVACLAAGDPPCLRLTTVLTLEQPSCHQTGGTREVALVVVLVDSPILAHVEMIRSTFGRAWMVNTFSSSLCRTCRNKDPDESGLLK